MSMRSDGAAGGITTLSLVPEGASIRLVGINAGHGLAARLAAMGLVPGVAMTVVNNKGGGPVAVDVRGTRLALGRGMAHKVLVQ